jgi:hypothetical protein
METIVSVIHVHKNKWVVVDVHDTSISILPVFHAIIISLHNMDYGQLTDEVYFCDSKLVCQIDIRFL